MRHVPIGSIEPEQVLATRAWLAARLGDEVEELDALEQLLDRAPGDARALERLIDRASRAGRDDGGRPAPPPQGRARPGRRGISTPPRSSASRPDSSIGWAGSPRPWADGSRRGDGGPWPRVTGGSRPRRAGPSSGWTGSREPSSPGPRPGRVAVVRAESQSVLTEDQRAVKPGGEASPRTVADALADLLAVARSRHGGPPARGDEVPLFRDDAHAAGLDFVLRQRPHAAVPAARDDDGRRGTARLRRRRLARRLRRAGGTSGRRGRTRGSGTGSSATVATARSRTSPPRRGWLRFPGVTATASPWATSTMTAGRTCSSPGGGRTRSIATVATARSRTSPRPRGWPAAATGRRPPPSPTSTATATSTSTSATIRTGIAGDPGRAPIRLGPARTPTATRAASRGCPTMSSATTAAGSST